MVRALERHTAAGRLTLDEYAERVDAVLAARTHGELAYLTRDLPAEPGDRTAGDDEPDGPADPHRVHAGQLLFAFLLAVLALVVLGVLLAVAR